MGWAGLDEQKADHCRFFRISGVMSLWCLALASSTSAALLISSSDWLYCLASVSSRHCQATDCSPSCPANPSRYSVRRVRTLRGRVQCLLRRAARQWVVGEVGGSSMSLSMATEALMTGMDILLSSDSTTFTSRSSVPSSHSSNMMPLNHALVLYSAFFSASYRCTFSFLLLPRSRRTAGTSQVRQNSSARTGSKLEAKMLTACAMACEVHSSGRVRASTSLQRSRLGMILKALGTLPLRYLLKIFPISPQTRLTSGLSSDLSSISLSLRSRALSQSAWLSSGPNPRISSSPISVAETLPGCSCGFAISTTSLSSVAARRRRCREAFFLLATLSLRLRSTALCTLRTRLCALSLLVSILTFCFLTWTFLRSMPMLLILSSQIQIAVSHYKIPPPGSSYFRVGCCCSF